MFKKILLAVAIALPMSAMAQKFGFVNPDEVIAAMPESAAMQTQIADTSKKYEEEYQKLQDELNKQFAEYQTLQNDPNTPESIKERRVQELNERAQKVDQFRQTAEQDMQRMYQTLSAPINAKFLEAVQAVGTEGGFTFIFPNEQSLLMFKSADVIDVTPLVRTKLGI